jgi:hypothetical protein
MPDTKSTSFDLAAASQRILDAIEREREREIIARRFGLFDRRETLEQIGELLGITRERVRQLEKAILLRLRAQASLGKLGGGAEAERILIKHLHELGRVATLQTLAAAIGDSERGEAHVALLARILTGLTVIDENDQFRPAVAIAEYYDEKRVQTEVTAIVKEIAASGQPISAEELHTRLPKFEHPDHIKALASVSKQLATLGGVWGLNRWPLVNPKNIRDKIYVVLKDAEEPKHFSEIAEAIKDSSFRRKDVTTQAIHNELIKDKRFVLIGRGIYALSEWGYKKGTVADVITEVLIKAGKPLHRDEIVKRVLKSRQVKETTILLNLQGKSQFKRVAKATYTLAEPAKA